MGLPSGPLEFDPDQVSTVKPPMSESNGFNLSAADLKNIFGIDAQRFGALPKRIVVPVLEGNYYMESWYSVTGWLYVVEPTAWVPQVSHEATAPVSNFTTEYHKETKSVSETKFNASASASLEITAGGTYLGVSASVKSSSSISFEVSKSASVDETLSETGELGKVPVFELFVYPTLKCKIIKMQRIEYTINDSSSELKWGTHSYDHGFWDARWVNDANLGPLRKLAFNPVPMDGNGLPAKAYLLPVPQNTQGGDVDITTVMSRTGWKDWYRYDGGEWQTPTTDKSITLAVPHNTIAFQPTGTWAVLD